MGEESFSAIFNDFMKANAAVLYQFSLSTEPSVPLQVPTDEPSNADDAPAAAHRGGDRAKRVRNKRKAGPGATGGAHEAGQAQAKG
jgi:hypothetical protein